jgi:hypothetical protein
MGERIDRALEIVSHGYGKAKGGFQTLALGAAIAAAAVGLATYESVNTAGKRRFDPDTVPLKPIPPMLTPQDLMQQMMPEEMSGPAEGREEFEFRNRVLAGRGQAPERAAAQPRMSVIAPESVNELGGVKPLTV